MGHLKSSSYPQFNFYYIVLHITKIYTINTKGK